ncbi:MAG: low specificity L-threonine aldolase [Vicinamibacterales bacterium]
MTRVNRRRFIKTSGLGAGASLAVTELPLAAQQAQRVTPAPASASEVRLSGDGLGLTPSEYVSLLARLVEEQGLTPDSYAIGGVVEQLETELARALGKERAVFMPSGTLANHLGIRALAGGSGRVVVQEESHLYQDEGDCAQTLSSLTLMPLGAGQASFTEADLDRVLATTRTGRVRRPVRVLSLESPVRRRLGEVFDPAERDRLVARATREGIRLHLDGARMFIEAAYRQVSVAELARPFETVYVSLYKYFNAASGAVLAGPSALLEDMFHERRMFGGGVYQAWPSAVVALDGFRGFDARYRRAVEESETFIRTLTTHDAFAVDRVAGGTNLFRLRVRGTDPATLRGRLAAQDIHLPAPAATGAFVLAVNETLLRRPAGTLAAAFVDAL